MIAKDAAAHASLCAQFAARSVSRRYEALLLGAPAPASGRVDAPVGRDPGERLRMAVVWAPGAPGARPAASRYETLEVLAAGRASRVAWRLETGRTHQIRVHLQSIGFALVGDAVYGKSHLTALFPRQALHAERLGLVHPSTGELCEWHAPLPTDMAALLERSGIVH